MARGVYGLRTKIRKETRNVQSGARTESHRIGVGRASGDDGQKRDHLSNNAATAASCINGSGGGGLVLGGVGGDGEEVCEEIHWCDYVVCGLTDAMELF